MYLSKTTIFLIFCAFFAIICGFLGFTLEIRSPQNKVDPFWKILNDAYKTASLFVLDGPDNLPLTGSAGDISDQLKNVARFLAPLSLGGAIVSAAVSFGAPKLNRLKALFARSHVIVAGSGDIAHHFLRHFGSGSSTVISISEPEADVNALRTSAGKKGLVFQGAAIDIDQWHAVSYQKAEVILIADREDQKNLDAANGLARLNWDDRIIRPKLYCHIKRTALRDELVNQTELFTRSSSIRLEPFSVSELASRSFFQKRDFFWEASLRNHERIHWLIIGGSDFSLTFLRHFLTICPHSELNRPLVTLVHDAVGDTLQPFDVLTTQCARFVEFDRIEFAEFAERLNCDSKPLDFLAPVTATLINSDDGISAVELSLALRRASFRNPQLKAPIFFAGDDVGNWDVGKFGKLSHYLHDEVSPIADVSELCTAAILAGEHDQAAIAFHHNYLASILVRDPVKIPSHRSWDELDENFRRSNRRAADHAKTKYERLGILGTPNINTLATQVLAKDFDQNLEALAEAEHDSWMTDRLIHGWRHSDKREDDRRLHPDLVPYEDLDELTKDKDREQIRELFRTSTNPVNPIPRLRVVKVGLIGRNQISIAEAQSICISLNERVLPQLCDDFSNHQFQFFSPLAPGSDLVSTQSVQAFFKKRDEPSKFFIVETVKSETLVDIYQMDRQSNACWGLTSDNQPATSSLTADISGCMRDFVRRHETISILTKNGQTFQQSLTANFDYFSSNMNVLIAYTGQGLSKGKFGTAATIKRAKANGLDVRLI